MNKTKIKLCGLTRQCDIEAANLLKPEFIGFVFAPKSKRYIAPETAALFRKNLSKNINCVGVFVNKEPEFIVKLLNQNVIDIAQLHGNEDENYIKKLRALTDKTIIKAFRISNYDDILSAKNSSADFVLLDSGSGGTGTTFDWNLIRQINRPYFLAGGLTSDNVSQALSICRPFAVDVSSGIEKDGVKDIIKMTAFVNCVRNAQIKEDKND